MDAQPLVNKRVHKRAHSFVSATIHKLNPDEGVNNEALVLNLSVGGLMLLTTYPFKKQDVFGISICIENERIIYVDVRVCWKLGDMVGVMFIDLEDADRDLIETVIESGRQLGEF